jgi:hypothetical protein
MPKKPPAPDDQPKRGKGRPPSGKPRVTGSAYHRSVGRTVVTFWVDPEDWAKIESAMAATGSNRRAYFVRAALAEAARVRKQFGG